MCVDHTGLIDDALFNFGAYFLTEILLKNIDFFLENCWITFRLYSVIIGNSFSIHRELRAERKYSKVKWILIEVYTIY